MPQKIITAWQDYRQLDQWLSDSGVRRLMLVCDASLQYMPALNAHLEALQQNGLTIARFSGFQPNPLIENVADGLALFRAEDCDGLMAVGGGSAMDVAKCIKLFCRMAPGSDYLRQPVTPNALPFLALPTTAGTGSEATRYAVVYENGRKQSVTHESCIPDTVLMDADALITLPLYQKKATMLDALCHAVESCWSVNSTDESRVYAQEAIAAVLRHSRGYLDNTPEGRAGMLRAANVAGKAINITQTTAGHAMCYQITGLFGCAHGHAAALCVRRLFPWTLRHMDLCADPRGADRLRAAFAEIAEAMGCPDAWAAAEAFEAFFDSLGLEVPAANEEQFAILRGSVNPERLKNHPIRLDEKSIDTLYHSILREKNEG